MTAPSSTVGHMSGGEEMTTEEVVLTSSGGKTAVGAGDIASPCGRVLVLAVCGVCRRACVRQCPHARCVLSRAAHAACLLVVCVAASWPHHCGHALVSGRLTLHINHLLAGGVAGVVWSEISRCDGSVTQPDMAGTPTPLPLTTTQLS